VRGMAIASYEISIIEYSKTKSEIFFNRRFHHRLLSKTREMSL